MAWGQNQKLAEVAAGHAMYLLEAALPCGWHATLVMHCDNEDNVGVVTGSYRLDRVANVIAKIREQPEQIRTEAYEKLLSEGASDNDPRILEIFRITAEDYYRNT